MIRDIGNLCAPGGMRDRQMFRNQRADLRGIAVGCLTSADNQIRAADHLNTLSRREEYPTWGLVKMDDFW